MMKVLICGVLLCCCHGAAMAQVQPDTSVRCAPDSVINQFRQLLNRFQFNADSSDVDWLPDSVSSNLGAKAHIIRDRRICSRAHEVYLRDAVENDSHPDRVAVARVGGFYFIYEDDFGVAVVQRHWKHVTVLTMGL